MFGFHSEPPLKPEDRQWVEDSTDKLIQLLGQERLLQAQVILPIPDYYPDPYDGSEASLWAIIHRTCGYMKVNPEGVELQFIVDQMEEIKDILPAWSGPLSSNSPPAGTYQEKPKEQKTVIALKTSLLSDPIGLISTLSHELAHLLLLGGKVITHEEKDMEPLTDLTTIFTGMGIFTANAAVRFSQYTEGFKQGWSLQRMGYLSQEMYGYALALFALKRGEKNPAWAKHLNTNVRSYFKQSLKFLQRSSRK